MFILESLTKEFGARTLFKNVQLNFPKGDRIALIGPNGAGKSTLLRILTGEIEPTSGQVSKPKDAVLGYLPQEPNPTPRSTLIEEVISGATRLGGIRDRMAQLLARYEENPEDFAAIEQYATLEEQFGILGGYSLEARASEILNGLGFVVEQFNLSPLTLSGGWRMRLELAKIFLNDPDILLLDEPTNHLDLPSLAWVEEYLLSYSGTLIFVSHDRPLLNRLATVTMEISQGRLTMFRGNFDAYLDYKELIAEQNAAARAQLQRKQNQLSEFVDRFGAKASKAKQAQSKLKQLIKLRAMEESIPEDEAAQSISMRLPKPPSCARVALKVDALSLGYPGKVLSPKVSFQVERGMKVAVIGANGIGKSTLIKTLMGRVAPLSGQITMGDQVIPAYFAQDQIEDLQEKDTVLANVQAVNYEIGEREARSLLGNLLFRGDDVFKKVKVLSGGEKNRVGLARVLVTKSNFLLLDEPTNHLDMSSVGVLASALADYEGTMMFVSHDRDFIDSVCTHVLVMLKDGRNELFEGKLEDYVRMAAISGFPNILTVDDAAKVKPKKETGPLDARKRERVGRSNAKNHERKLENIEGALTKLKSELGKIDHELSELASSTDHLRLVELGREREELLTRIAETEEQWLEIASQSE